MRHVSRRHLLHATAGVAALSGRVFPRLEGQESQFRLPGALHLYDRRAAVALVKGDNRRKNIHDALAAIDELVRPKLYRKKYVVIKPNNVSTVKQLASTHADALRGILDYLAPRFKGPVVIAESSAGETRQGYENFRYDAVAREYPGQNVQLVDLNEEARYQVLPVLDRHLHVAPVRVAARLLDPDAFVVCAAILKTHSAVITTLSIKNMVLGGALHSAPKETPRWSDKGKYHGGIRQMHYDIMLAAQRMLPFWGVTVIDGFEGMEGDGPTAGTPVPSRLAIASTDFVAADRVGVEVMGINPDWPGYLMYCGQVGLGQYDLQKIDLRGERIETVRRTYQLHRDIERLLQWRGPLTEPPAGFD